MPSVARDAAHALKGAARSAGMHRLGDVASEIQDRLDEGAMALAAELQPRLTPAFQEVRSAVEQLELTLAKA